MYKLDQFLPNEIELNTFDPNNGLPELDGYEALFVRTVTPLNPQFIPKIPDSLKLIGTGSSGSDHIDKAYFESHGVKMIDAKGCNANAVSEYVMTALLLWSIKKRKKLQTLAVGIVGFGATGTAVAKQLTKFKIPFTCYDPPKEQQDTEFKSSSLEEVLGCDVLTFHVPLSKTGNYPTFHWLDEEKLSGNEFELIINTARGGVVDEKILLKNLSHGSVKDAIIDVWKNEPDFNPELVERAFIATPHIAGYSEQAKLNASKFLAEKIATCFDLELPNTSHLYGSINVELADLAYSLYELLLRFHPMREYDAHIRDIAHRADKQILFKKLRTEQPYRFEFPYLRLKKDLYASFPELKKLSATF